MWNVLCRGISAWSRTTQPAPGDRSVSSGEQRGNFHRVPQCGTLAGSSSRAGGPGPQRGHWRGLLVSTPECFCKSPAAVVIWGGSRGASHCKIPALSAARSPDIRIPPQGTLQGIASCRRARQGCSSSRGGKPRLIPRTRARG